MAEIDSSVFRTDDSLYIDRKEVWNDLYKLGSYFLASKRWCDDGPVEFDLIRKGYEEKEIVSLLISIAIKLRNKFDVFKHESETSINESGSNVGELQNDMNSSSRQKLNLREACNKIIHTKKLNFDYDDSYPEPIVDQVLNLKIHLYGDFWNKKWKATINVMNFIEAVAVCFPSNF